MNTTVRKPNPARARGWRGPGGGAWRLLAVPAQLRAPSTQACGAWPFAAGDTRPQVGVPLGYDLNTGTTVCADPFAWFDAGFISSPSQMVLGLNGHGKSSLVAHQIIGLADRGVIPLVAGDLKPDYTKVIAALGGQVIGFSAGQSLNPLDQAAMTEAASRIGGPAGAALADQAIDRSATLVGALIQIVRRARCADWEAGLLTRAIKELTRRHSAAGSAAPTFPELAALLREPSEALAVSVLAEDASEYRALTKPLNRTMAALLDGPLGVTFAGSASTRLDTGAAGVCVDISAVARGGEELLAAVMLATWTQTFAAVEAANALTDAGIAPQRHFLTVMDEMWRPMRIGGAGLIDKLDGITRLNRAEGVGHIFITHTLKDLAAIDNPADAAKAKGFLERSGIIATAALTREDLIELSGIRRLTGVEIDTVAGWSTPPGWATATDTGRTRPAAAPGVGKLLIKVGQRPGIPTQVVLTPTELALHDSNHRWTRHAAATASVAVPEPREPEPPRPEPRRRPRSRAGVATGTATRKPTTTRTGGGPDGQA